MALFATLAFLAVIVRLFQLQVARRAPSTRPSRTRTSSAASSLPTTRGVIRDANGKVLASSRPSYDVEVVPGPRHAERAPVRYRNGLPSPRDPDSWPQLADILRLNPEERRTFEARIRAACVERRRQVAVLEDADPRARGRPARHRGRAEAAHRRARGRRGRGRARSASTRTRSSARTCSATSPRSTRETLAKYRPPGLRGRCPREEQQRVNPLGYEGGDTRRRDGHRARVGVVPARAARLGEARRRRARPLPDGPRGRAPRRPAGASSIPSRGATCACRSTSTSSRRSTSAMRPHAAGAVVAVDVRTGRLLALYSKPDFDPNDLSGGEGHARVREAFNAPLRRSAAPDARQDDERRLPARARR